MFACLLSLEHDLQEDGGLIFLAHWWASGAENSPQR